MNELKVITSKLQIVLVTGLGLFFVPAGLWMLLSGLRGGKLDQIGFGAILLLFFAVLLFIIVRAYRRSVGYFSSRGIGRNDGAEMPWSMLSRTVDKMTTRDNGKPVLWRTEIQFNDGTNLWLIPSKISNWPEVRDYIATLPCEHAVEPA